MTEEVTLAPGALLAGTYIIEHLIGKGGMGEVYAARHARLSGRYAVKLLVREITANEEALRRFRQEAEVTSRLRHPNIVQVVDFAAREDGTPFMVMELIDGHDLAHELRAVGRLSVERTVDLVEQVASGLAAAHAEGIVHRDLKPANVFVTRLRGSDRELAKIVDFGISKVRTATMGMTKTHMLIGTPQYMAPEQALGRTQEIQAATDQFALGVMAWELLAGQPPFTGDALGAVVYQIVHEPPPSFASLGLDVPPAVEAAIVKALAKAPGERHADVTAFAAALRQALAGGPPIRSVAPTFSPQMTAMLPPVAGARETTFRGTASELGATTERTTLPRRRALWVGGGVAAVLAVGAFVALRAGGPAPGADAPAGPAAAARPDPAPAAPAPDSIHVRVLGAVSGLTATVDGQPSPFPLRLPRRSQPYVLVFSAPGHEDQRLELPGTEDVTVPLSLRKREEPAVVKPPPAAAEPTPAPERRRPGRTSRRPANVVTDL